ncbi:hypothetical protein LIA77_00860 [Sarocladium implicatum]|nr:hypothetical protein LIA77_00860 [Sarocladium implicatum]
MASSTVGEDDASANWFTGDLEGEPESILGINDFAKFITTLALQNPGAPLQSEILPRHVFELQILVDSFVVSKGWRISAFGRHMVRRTVANRSPTQDLKDFLYKEPTGAFRGLVALSNMSESTLTGKLNSSTHSKFIRLAKAIESKTIDTLAACVSSDASTPSSSDPSTVYTSDLFADSPLLCGTAMLDGLYRASTAGLMLCGSIPEVKIAIHLHNMLVCQGYLKHEPSSPWRWFTETFGSDIFTYGKAPSELFLEALVVGMSHVSSLRQRRTLAQVSSKVKRCREQRRRRGHSKRKPSRPGHDAFCEARYLMDPSLMDSLNHVAWDPDCVLDDDLPLTSFLGMWRLDRARMSRLPRSGKMLRQGVALTRRYERAGYNVDKLIKLMPWRFKESASSEPLEPPKLTSNESPREKEEFERISAPLIDCFENTANHRGIMRCIRQDAGNCIAGSLPYWGVSYTSLLREALELFGRIERELAAMGNVVYKDAYEKGHSNPRLELVCLAMRDRNDECLKVMAKHFELSTSTFTSCVYWDDLNMTGETDLEFDVHERDAQCSVM